MIMVENSTADMAPSTHESMVANGVTATPRVPVNLARCSLIYGWLIGAVAVAEDVVAVD